MIYISVIIPLYNKNKSIKDCIKSVLCQTYEDFELLVVDDGSTDNSVDIVKTFSDKRITLHQKKNEGVSSARNYGAKYSKGKFLFFLDADDYIINDCLETLLNLADEYPIATVVSGNHVNVKDGSEEIFCLNKKRGIVSNPSKQFFHGEILPRTGASLYDREVFFRVGGFDEKISIFEDLDLDIKFLTCCIYAYTPKVVYKHILDNAELSIAQKPFEKYFAYYINIDTQPFWIKMKMIYCIFATYYKFKNSDDRFACKFLKKKLKSHYMLVIFFRIYEKYCQYRRLYLLKNIKAY